MLTDEPRLLHVVGEELLEELGHAHRSSICSHTDIESSKNHASNLSTPPCALAPAVLPIAVLAVSLDSMCVLVFSESSAMLF